MPVYSYDHIHLRTRDPDRPMSPVRRTRGTRVAVAETA